MKSPVYVKVQIQDEHGKLSELSTRDGAVLAEIISEQSIRLCLAESALERLHAPNPSAVASAMGLNVAEQEVKLDSQEEQWVISALKEIATSNGTTRAAQRGIKLLIERLERHAASVMANDKAR